MIEILSEDLRQIYETTENEFNLRVQLSIKNNKSLVELKKELNKANQRSLDRVKLILEDKKFDSKEIINNTILINDRLIRSAIKEYQNSKLVIKRLEKVIPLKEAIFKQTQIGIDKGLSIRTGGRTWSYKAYMEMAVRTTIQNEIGEQQLDAGRDNGIVFYISNVFADCADDHKDYQGKKYYDKNYKTFVSKELAIEIDKIIRQENMLSVQEVRDKKPYLTTRPNCRHTLKAISIEQALTKSSKTLVDELKIKTCSYKPKNYQELQTQRYNERMIRKYKERIEMNEELGYDTTKDKRLVKVWQERQRELIKSNPNLQRDYRRESNKVLLTDLGAKYNKQA